jgi:putative glutamine amidotransferase
VRVAPGSRLGQALGPAVDAQATCRVNSRHHQSVGKIGSGLVATATAEDGVVEAIEAPDASFCIGVQWHPENFWRTGEFDALFSSFVAAARQRLASRRRS